MDLESEKTACADDPAHVPYKEPSSDSQYLGCVTNLKRTWTFAGVQRTSGIEHVKKPPHRCTRSTSFASDITYGTYDDDGRFVRGEM